MALEVERTVLTYDVGGSHVSAAVCRGDACRLGPVASARYPAEQSSEAFVNFLYALGVEASAGFVDPSGAEIAVPGPFDFSAGVSWMRHKLPFLYGVNLRQPLAERFGWEASQIRFLKDASAFLLGEIASRAARGAPRAVGITLGTGIGSAFSVNGRLVTEGRGVPPDGEIWNLPYKGRIVEDFLSTRAIQQNYERRTGVVPDVTAIAAAAGHDQDAAAVFTDFGRHLGLALRMVLSQFAPQAVVLGGGISRSAHLFLPAAQSQLEDLKIRLEVSALKDLAPLVGAAVEWFNTTGVTEAPSLQPVPKAIDAELV
jgi:glucokinase